MRAHQLGPSTAPHPAASATGLPGAPLPRLVRRHLHPVGLLHGGPHLPGAAGHVREALVGGPAARRLLRCLAQGHGDAAWRPGALAGVARLDGAESPLKVLFVDLTGQHGEALEMYEAFTSLAQHAKRPQGLRPVGLGGDSIAGDPMGEALPSARTVPTRRDLLGERTAYLGASLRTLDLLAHVAGLRMPSASSATPSTTAPLSRVPVPPLTEAHCLA